MLRVLHQNPPDTCASYLHVLIPHFCLTFSIFAQWLHPLSHLTSSSSRLFWKLWKIWLFSADTIEDLDRNFLRWRVLFFYSTNLDCPAWMSSQKYQDPCQGWKASTLAPLAVMMLTLFASSSTKSLKNSASSDPITKQTNSVKPFLLDQQKFWRDLSITVLQKKGPILVARRYFHQPISLLHCGTLLLMSLLFGLWRSTVFKINQFTYGIVQTSSSLIALKCDVHHASTSKLFRQLWI